MPDYEKITWYDLVKDQNGDIIQEGTKYSAKNMNRMEEGINLADNIVGALVAEVMQKVGATAKELEKWQNQRLQQGTVTLYNKYVIEGCKINKMPNSRYIEICRGNEFMKGDVSSVYVDGKIVGLSDEQTVLMIPQNNTESSKVFFIYVDYFDNQYKLNISEIEPVDKLVIYKATVPIGDLRPDLESVVLSDVRKINNNKYLRDNEPFTTINIPGLPMLSDDYDVHVTVDTATDIAAVGDILVYDKQLNGFKIRISGNADNVKLRWVLINSKIK